MFLPDGKVSEDRNEISVHRSLDQVDAGRTRIRRVPGLPGEALNSTWYLFQPGISPGQPWASSPEGH